MPGEIAIEEVLLPTRLHMFFRGLPGLFACANPQCNHARERAEPRVLGKLHTQPTDLCECGSRVYELLTHRECGTAFLRGYMDGAHGTFLWHVPSGPLREGHQAPLTEVELLVDGAPHPDEMDQCVPAWLDVRSGQILYDDPGDRAGFLRVFLPSPGQEWGQRALRFPSCPVCRRAAIRGARSTIMDHSTKGEAPFANLVKRSSTLNPRLGPNRAYFQTAGARFSYSQMGGRKLHASPATFLAKSNKTSSGRYWPLPQPA